MHARASAGQVAGVARGRPGAAASPMAEGCVSGCCGSDTPSHGTLRCARPGQA